MKILYEVGSTCVGGAERVVLKIAQGLRRIRPDWLLDCLVLCERGGLEAEYRTTFNKLWDGPPEYRLSGHRIAGLVAMNNYDIVHAIDSFELVKAAAALCPQTAFLQNVFPNVDKSPFAPSSVWLADQNNPYSAIVTEFQANLAKLPRPGRFPHALEVIPNGINTEFWQPGPADRDVDVLWVARTDPEKGIQVAMDLVPLLCGRGLKYVMVTSEDDGPQETLNALASQFPTFTHMARLTPLQLRSLYCRSKLFIQTSTVEGTPATPLEAAACGCWPLCSAVDGVAEAFARRPTCLVGEPLSADHFFALIQLTLGDIQRGLDSYARELVVDNFSLDAMVNRYTDLYERIA